MADVDADDAISALLTLEFDFFLRMAFAELGGQGAYMHGYYIDAIIHQLDRVRLGENRRLAVTIPPRHLKSRIVSVAWVAWMFGRNPALSFLWVSYGQDLRGLLARLPEAYPKQLVPPRLSEREARHSVGQPRPRVWSRRFQLVPGGSAASCGRSCTVSWRMLNLRSSCTLAQNLTLPLCPVRA